MEGNNKNLQDISIIYTTRRRKKTRKLAAKLEHLSMRLEKKQTNRKDLIHQKQ
jgi:hypothetical protein